MTNKGDRLPRIVSLENGFDGPDNPRLRIDCALPAVKTFFGVGEEPVRRLLEFRRWQEAGGRPVIFMHRLDDLYLRSGGFGEDAGGFDRLGFGAGNNAA
ncbi:hypothetical protein D3C71_781370 [compost metagenome]